MKVGFIGLGNMGIGMAANLLKAGHKSRCTTALRQKPKRWCNKGRIARPVRRMLHVGRLLSQCSPMTLLSKASRLAIVALLLLCLPAEFMSPPVPSA